MINEQELQLTPGQARTAVARHRAALAAQDKRADWLRARGWKCIPPTDPELVTARGDSPECICGAAAGA